MSGDILRYQGTAFELRILTDVIVQHPPYTENINNLSLNSFANYLVIPCSEPLVMRLSLNIVLYI